MEHIQWSVHLFSAMNRRFFYRTTASDSSSVHTLVEPDQWPQLSFLALHKHVYNAFQSQLKHEGNNSNKTGSAHTTQHWAAFLQALLQWKSNKYYANGVCIRSLRYPACNAHTPYCHLCPAPLYNIFPHYPINGTIFERKSLNIQCMFRCPLQVLSETFLILRRIREIWLEMNIGFHIKYPLFFSDSNETSIFSTDFRKNTEISNFMKSVQREPSCSMRTLGRTDMTKLIVALHNFAHAPKNCEKYRRGTYLFAWYLRR
jgi:hypothetical protein